MHNGICCAWDVDATSSSVTEHVGIIFSSAFFSQLVVLYFPAHHLCSRSGCRHLGAVQQSQGLWSLNTNLSFFQTFITFNLSLSQIVDEMKQFYNQTFNNYKATKQPALAETLKAIQYAVSWFFILCTFISWKLWPFISPWMSTFSSLWSASMLWSNWNGFWWCLRHLSTAAGFVGLNHNGNNQPFCIMTNTIIFHLVVDKHGFLLPIV